MRERGRPGPGTGSYCRRRHPHRSPDRPGAGCQVCRSLAALSAGADLCSAGHPVGSIDPCRLGRAVRMVSSPLAGPYPGTTATIRAAVCRRDDSASARSRTRADQDRPAMGLCAGRPTMGRYRSADDRLCLCSRPQERARRSASGGLCRHPAGRRLWRIYRARQAAAADHSRVLLVTRPAQVLRSRRQVTGCYRGAAADRRSICRRERGSRHRCRSSSRSPQRARPRHRR